MKKKNILREKKYHLSIAESVRVIRESVTEDTYRQLVNNPLTAPIFSYRLSKKLVRNPY